MLPPNRKRWIAFAAAGVLALVVAGLVWLRPSSVTRSPGIVVETAATSAGRVKATVRVDQLQPGESYTVLLATRGDTEIGASDGILGRIVADDEGSAVLAVDMVSGATRVEEPLTTAMFRDPGGLISVVSSAGEKLAEARIIIPAADAASQMPDGEHFVFVRRVEGAMLVVDEATLLTGPEALQAAVADGVVRPGEDLPNDFYIRNATTDEVSVRLSEGASFIVIGFDVSGALEDVAVDTVTLLGLLAGDQPTLVYGLMPSEFPMTLEFRDGEVVGGRQQYLP